MNEHAPDGMLLWFRCTNHRYEFFSGVHPGHQAQMLADGHRELNLGNVLIEFLFLFFLS